MCNCEKRIHPGIKCSSEKCNCHKTEGPTLTEELSSLLNQYSRENSSNTPDFILAQYMHACLEAFEEATRRRDEWYGRPMTDVFHVQETL